MKDIKKLIVELRNAPYGILIKSRNLTLTLKEKVYLEKEIKRREYIQRGGSCGSIRCYNKGMNKLDQKIFNEVQIHRAKKWYSK